MKEEAIFELCRFQRRPLDKAEYIKLLKEYLEEVPATVTTRDIEAAKESQKHETKPTEDEGDVDNGGDDIDGGETGTTPLHAICESVDGSDEAQVGIALEMIDVLFLHGANWIMLDDNNETPGCIAVRRGLPSVIYDRFVSAGTRAEIFLRRMTESDNSKHTGDTGGDQDAYLRSGLQYDDTTLTTTDQQDGVMMDWETPIMKRSAELITQHPRAVVLNVGFGMGIIDSFIQEHKPSKHYICEAHPDVLERMERDGWFDKPGVVVLKGRWQDTVPKLFEEDVSLTGVYYDTFSEHYQDMLEFIDYAVGLLHPDGVMSFFNGLGADRQVCYDVYANVVEVDITEYGLRVEWERLPVSESALEQQQHLKRKYWTLSEYLLPKIRFMAL
jgi:protein arginine N-methyltransferase 2